MEIKKRKMIILSIALLLFVGIFARNFINSRKEYNQTLSFIVSKVEVSDSGSVKLYDNKKRILIYNYRLSEYTNLKVGDSIYKGNLQQYLLIYRKEVDGKYKLIAKEKPTGVFGGFWTYK